MTVIDMEDTVVIHDAESLPDNETRTRDVAAALAHDPEPVTRVIPMMPRRPDATGEIPLYRRQADAPRTIGVVDAPLDTDQLPPLAAWGPVYVRPAEPDRYRGRHRTGLVAWLVRRIGGAR